MFFINYHHYQESSDGLKDKRRGLTGEKSKRGERFLQKKKEKAIFIPSACDMNHKRGEEIGEVNLKLEKKCNERDFAFVMGVMKLWNSVGFCQILEWKGEWSLGFQVCCFCRLFFCSFCHCRCTPTLQLLLYI